jgi:hypothetical protein
MMKRSPDRRPQTDLQIAPRTAARFKAAAEPGTIMQPEDRS